ncbi:hypothetical protein LQV63_11320 [Paenibacillus profundus]|uniref:NERD domain-containing protein n=1 Tax=Paenibacillus profundus TaxID=1173085 RepID=A0ABS8YD11_9BACL|nr:hypothetical protein [Paenibacillus profundus]MCE5169901.1 hypothetical protein [Paenibacillus profundus]
MKCPFCSKEIDLLSEEIVADCPQCMFFFYLKHTLRIMFIAYSDVENNQETYFHNLHRDIYDPFIVQYQDSITPREGAISMGEYIISQIKNLVKGYPKEDLLFMVATLREAATWNIFEDNIWASSHLRSIGHILTNLVESFNEELFGIDSIMYENDFVSILILTEELGKIVSNVFHSKVFGWDNNLSDMIKTRIENEKLDWFHSYYEVKELLKPEEIEFDDEQINYYLQNRKMTTSQIKKEVNGELHKLFGFSTLDLKKFRDKCIRVAEKNGQILEFTSRIQGMAMKVCFVFIEQLSSIEVDKEIIENIRKNITYIPTYRKGNPLIELLDPYMDYKFLFEYENLIAFGVLDSGNSISIFDNLSVTDHYIQDIFGERATTPFKKAQEKIASLMAYKIAYHFDKINDYYVPKIHNGIPNINIKIIQGNGVRKRIVDVHNQDLGDVDVIVVDIINKKIFNIEIKYYKPSTGFIEILKKDKKIFEDITKIKKRSQWIKENTDTLITAWELPLYEYLIETIVVTARPNYFGKELEKQEQVIYKTFDEILRTKDRM